MQPIMGASHAAGLHLLAEGGEFNPLNVGEWTLWFWTFVVFAILFILLRSKVWGPLMKTIDDREQSIKSEIESAKADRAEAERALAEHRQKLDESAQEAKRLLDDARGRAESLVGEMQETAKAEIQAEREKARSEIQAEREKALADIKEQVVELSVAINERLAMGSNAPEDHRKQAEELLVRLKDAV